MPVTLRGVDPEAYARITSVDSIIFEGAKMKDLTPADAAVSVGTGQQLAIYATGGTLLLFAPRREGRVNTANPMSSFLTDSVSVAGIFRAMQSDYDNNTVICDITTARNLFQYTTEATQLEVKATPNRPPRARLRHRTQPLPQCPGKRPRKAAKKPTSEWWKLKNGSHSCSLSSSC